MCCLFLNCYEQRTRNWFVFDSWNKHLAFAMTVSGEEHGESWTEWDGPAVSESRRGPVFGSGRTGLLALLPAQGPGWQRAVWFARFLALWARQVWTPLVLVFLFI